MWKKSDIVCEKRHRRYIEQLFDPKIYKKAKFF